MLYVALAFLLAGAALCLGLGRRVATRTLGLVAAALCALAALALALEPGAGVERPAQTLLTIGELELALRPILAPPERALASGLLGGAAALLLLLGSAIAAPVREFGAIFAWSLLAVAAALLSLATPVTSLLLPLAWAVGALACYNALRSSGTLARNAGLPGGLIASLFGSVLLLGSMAGAAPTLAAGDQPPTVAALCALAAMLAMAGLPPLHGAHAEAGTAPAPLGALIYALVLPTLALGTLLRLVSTLPLMPTSWSNLLVGLGALGALATAGGALGERSLRPLLAWLAGGQAATVLAAAGLGDALAGVSAHILLLGLMLSGVAGAAAVSALERSTGSDDYTSATPGPRLRLAGLLWATCGAAAIGLPPFFSHWGRRWLLEGALALAPWALPALLAAGVLTTLAVLAPLARFLAPHRPERAPATSGWATAVAGGAALLALLALGIAPQLAWEGWLRFVTLAPAALPIGRADQALAVGGGLMLATLAGLIAARPPARAAALDPEEEPVRLAPDGLAAGLAPLAWLGRPAGLLRALWDGLAWLSNLLRVAMALFEQRYYLLGVLVVLIVMMLLMAQ